MLFISVGGNKCFTADFVKRPVLLIKHFFIYVQNTCRVDGFIERLLKLSDGAVAGAGATGNDGFLCRFIKT